MRVANTRSIAARLAIFGVLFVSAPLAAQSAAAPLFTGSLGGVFRREDGGTASGPAFAAGVRWPGRDDWFSQLDLMIVQLYAPPTGTTPGFYPPSNISENSVALRYQRGRSLTHSGNWSLDGALGALVSVATGCGRDTCTTRYAESGNVRTGATLSLASAWRFSQGLALSLGAGLEYHTAAAGNAVAPTITGQLAVPLR